MDHTFLFHVFVFLAAACIVVPLASRFMLGSVLGYLAAGVLIGPYGLAFIANAEQIMHFAEFGVVMMLFLIGLELEPAMLWRMRAYIVGMGGLQVLVTTAAFTVIGLMLGYDWRLSLTVSMALSLSSTALVLQILQEKHLMHTTMGESAFAVLLFQDIAVIPMLIIIPLLAANAEGAVVHTGILHDLPGWLHALVVAGVIGFVVGVGRYLSHHLFRFIAKTNLREVFTAFSLALVVGITLLMQLVGVSPALGAFIAGVVLATSEYKRTLETDIEPFKGLLLGLFFISVGMNMNFGLFGQYPMELLAAVVTLMAVKAVILYGLGLFCKLDFQHNSGFALALLQGGEFAFVLFQFAGGLGILNAEQAAFLVMTVTLSIAATPLFMMLYSRYLVPRFMSLLPERPFDHVDARNGVILAGYGRFGQIIGRFLSAQGVSLTILEKDPDQVELLRKFGFKGYFGDANRLDLMHSAGADKAKVLIVAVDDPDTCLDIVRMAKEHFPQLVIYARARNRRHAYELDKLGVDYFKRETFDSALDMAQEIMVGLGGSRESVRIKARLFRRHDEETLRKSFALYGNEPELISFSRQATGELERILQSDTLADASGEEGLKRYG